jgi:hypothetical protein
MLAALIEQRNVALGISKTGSINLLCCINLGLLAKIGFLSLTSHVDAYQYCKISTYITVGDQNTNLD